MSNAILNLAWNADVPPMEKLVLAALADFANDLGEAWPSIATLCRRTGAGERSVYRSIKSLKDAGHLSYSANLTGRSTRYTIHPCQRGTPATAAALSDRQVPLPERQPSPVTVAGDPCQRGTLTIKEPIMTLQEPPAVAPLLPVSKPLKASEKSWAAKGIAAEPAKPSEVSDQVWSDFCALRKRQKADLSETALVGIRSQADKAGWSLEAALTECVVRGWRGFKAAWVKGDAAARQATDQPATATNVTDAFMRRMERHEGRRGGPQ